MILNDKMDCFINRLKDGIDLSNYKIIKAYPYVRKPTRLENILIAVSFGEIEAQNIEIGGADLYGSYIVNVTVFAPYGMNDINQLIKAIVESQLGAYPSSISVSEINKDDDLRCLSAKCSFTFFDDFSFGGNLDE